MKIGDLVITKQCIWHYGSEVKQKRIGIILNIFELPALGTIVDCWFDHIGYFQTNIKSIELLEDSC
tara:strand:- start:85 stop:282 length:198 start_codon:yes stop_codon:yes gene_type:complete